MGDSSEFQNIIHPIFQVQKFAVLATFSSSQPYSNLVAFASTNDLKQILFVTNRNTRKFSNILENNRVAMLIDDRKNEQMDFNNAHAVTAIGAAREITGDERNILSQIYLVKHPSRMEFLKIPESVLLSIIVNEYIIAGFDKSQRFLNI